MAPHDTSRGRHHHLHSPPARCHHPLPPRLETRSLHRLPSSLSAVTPAVPRHRAVTSPGPAGLGQLTGCRRPHRAALQPDYRLQVAPPPPPGGAWPRPATALPHTTDSESDGSAQGAGTEGCLARIIPLLVEPAGCHHAVLTMSSCRLEDVIMPSLGCQSAVMVQ